MRFTSFLLAFSLFVFTRGITIKTESTLITPPNPSTTNCGQAANYIPNPDLKNQYPPRYVKVNFHVVQKSDGSGNLPEEEFVTYVHSLISTANQRIWRNKKMNLPPNNDTPALDGRYGYKLTPDENIPGDDGIYIHRNDTLFNFVTRGKNRNDYDKKVFERLGVQKGKVLNVFVMAHNPDSLATGHYGGSFCGIAFPRESWLKIGGCFMEARDTMMKKEDGSIRYKGGWAASAIFNHEAGHVLGLRHTWRGHDKCDDTPVHTNCYGPSKKEPCNTGFTSNNVMDYNLFQNSWSPCQLGIIHWNFANKNSVQRRVLVRSWCEFKEFRTVHIKDTMTWNHAKDLEGNLIIHPDASLTIQCRVSFPKGGKIIVRPGGELILDGCVLENDCGELWEGIEIEKKKGLAGRVIYENDAVVEDVF